MQHVLQGTRKSRFLGGVAGAALAASMISVGMPFSATPAYADTAAEIQSQADAALQELNSMNDTANEYYNTYIQALADYQTAVSNLDQAAAQIDDLNSQMDQIQDRLGDRARSMYRSGSTSAIDLLLGATSFEQFTTNWDLLGRMNQNDADLVQQAKDLRIQVEEQKAAYQQQADAAQKKADEASESYQKAQDTIAQMQQVYDNLSAEAQAAYQQESAANSSAYYAQAAAEYGATVNSDGSVYDSNTGQTYSSISSYSAATGNSIVDRARAMIGSNYVWGGTGGSWGGFDCSGLVSYAITGQEGNRIGTTYTFMGYQADSTPQVGDLVVNAGHVAIVSGVDGNGNITSIIHAVNTNVGVAETGMSGYFSPGDYQVVKAG